MKRRRENAERPGGQHRDRRIRRRRIAPRRRLSEPEQRQIGRRCVRFFEHRRRAYLDDKRDREKRDKAETRHRAERDQRRKEEDEERRNFAKDAEAVKTAARELDVLKQEFAEKRERAAKRAAKRNAT